MVKRFDVVSGGAVGRNLAMSFRNPGYYDDVFSDVDGKNVRGVVSFIEDNELDAYLVGDFASRLFLGQPVVEHERGPYEVISIAASGPDGGGMDHVDRLAGKVNGLVSSITEGRYSTGSLRVGQAPIKHFPKFSLAKSVE